MEADRYTETSDRNRLLGRSKRRMRDGMSETERLLGSIRVGEKLRRLEAYRKAENVLVYASIGSELSTEDIIQMAFTDGKKVFCPKVEEKQMNFYRITSVKELYPGCMGIPEPEGNKEVYAASKNSIVVAPGSAFDRSGHRIGYGGGYYDRWLAQFSDGERPYCAGVCFSCQLTEEIQPLPHDMAMDIVLFA